jgi:hypothetical protein
MRLTGIFSDHLFRSYSSLETGSQNIKRPNRCGFYISSLDMSFSFSFFEMHSQGASQQQYKSDVCFFQRGMFIDFDI